MRLRYKLVTYHFGEDHSSQQSVERHYRELMDELLRQGQHHSMARHAVQWRPAADIHETPDAILVKMELAGMREEDIEVTLYEDALVVTGRRDDDVSLGHGVYYHEAQIRYGPFRAEVLLPVPVERDRVEARYENGFLRVMLPKAANLEPTEKRIEVSPVTRASSVSQPLQAEPAENTQEPLPTEMGQHDSVADAAAVPALPSVASDTGPLLATLGRGGLRDA